MGLFFAHFFVKLQSIIVYRSKYVTVYSGSGRENSKQYTIYLLFLVRFITSKRSKHQQFKINIYVMGRSSGILPKNVEFGNNRIHHNILCQQIHSVTKPIRPKSSKNFRISFVKCCQHFWKFRREENIQRRNIKYIL